MLKVLRRVNRPSTLLPFVYVNDMLLWIKQCRATLVIRVRLTRWRSVPTTQLATTAAAGGEANPGDKPPLPPPSHLPLDNQALVEGSGHASRAMAAAQQLGALRTESHRLPSPSCACAGHAESQ